MEEKIKKRRLVLPIFIIIIMSFSILGFSFFWTTPGGKIVKYKENKFNLVNNLWVTYVNDKALTIKNDPSLLNEINLDRFNLKPFGKIYLSRDPNVNLNYELSGLNNLESFSNILLVDSCFEELEGCENLPLKKCGDAVNGIGVIEISLENENSVKRDKDCLKIHGNSDFISKVIDKILLDTVL